MIRNFALIITFVVLAAASRYLASLGITLGEVSRGQSVTSFLVLLFGVLAAYQIGIVGIRLAIARRRGVPGEVRMLAGLARVGAGVAIVIVLLSSMGRLTAVGAVVAGFAGLLLGWSLQAPVSGMAAWALITVKRPFRVGDRILLPSLNLNGDVIDVGLMYTSLNQVGGSVGSEEAIGRHILIPNAMLFNQVVINYTPEMRPEESSYFLDEVVVRITFDSDWEVAENLLLSVAREVTGDIIKQTGNQPYIRSDFYDYGIYMRLRYMTMATDRPRITHEITKRIFRAFQRDLRVDLAIPYVYSYRHSLPSERFRYPAEGQPVEEIPISEIDDQWQPGTLPPAQEEAIDDLAKHIQTVGLLQPLVVERKPQGGYTLIAGTIRLRACKQLAWTRVPATIREPGTPPEPRA